MRKSEPFPGSIKAIPLYAWTATPDLTSPRLPVALSGRCFSRFGQARFDPLDQAFNHFPFAP